MNLYINESLGSSVYTLPSFNSSLTKLNLKHGGVARFVVQLSPEEGLNPITSLRFGLRRADGKDRSPVLIAECTSSAENIYEFDVHLNNVTLAADFTAALAAGKTTLKYEAEFEWMRSDADGSACRSSSAIIPLILTHSIIQTGDPASPELKHYPPPEDVATKKWVKDNTGEEGESGGKTVKILKIEDVELDYSEPKFKVSLLNSCLDDNVDIYIFNLDLQGNDAGVGFQLDLSNVFDKYRFSEKIIDFCFSLYNAGMLVGKCSVYAYGGMYDFALYPARVKQNQLGDNDSVFPKYHLRFVGGAESLNDRLTEPIFVDVYNPVQGVPVGGKDGQILSKLGDWDETITWRDPISVPKDGKTYGLKQTTSSALTPVEIVPSSPSAAVIAVNRGSSESEPILVGKADTLILNVTTWTNGYKDPSIHLALSDGYLPKIIYLNIYAVGLRIEGLSIFIKSIQAPPIGYVTLGSEKSATECPPICFVYRGNLENSQSSHHYAPFIGLR